MSKNVRLIQLVFNDIVEHRDRISAMERFLTTDHDLNINQTEDIRHYKELYEKLVNEIIDPLKELAHLEEMIVQMRCLQMMPKEIKFYISREYVYARTLFYRSDMEIKDIRVMVGRLDDFDEPFEDLIQYPEFIILAENKLRDAMVNHIDANKEAAHFIESLHDKNLAESE